MTDTPHGKVACADAWSGLMVVASTAIFVFPTTGNKPAKQEPLQDDTQAIPTTKRRRGAGVVAPEFSQQLQGVGHALFRNHDALGVVAANLQAGQKASQMAAMDEHRNVVSLEKRRYNRNLGFRLWGQHSNERHDA